MSYLLLEEASDSHDAKAEAAQAFLARSGASVGSSSAGATAGSPAGSGATNGGSGGSAGGSSGSGGYRSKSKKKGLGSGGSATSHPGGGDTQFGSTTPSVPWTQGYNPWTGLVPASSVPIRAPAPASSAHGRLSSPNRR
jgi:hypothetical protein